MLFLAVNIIVVAFSQAGEHVDWCLAYRLLQQIDIRIAR